MHRKNTAAYGKPIKVVYSSYVYVCMLSASQSGLLEYTNVVVGRMVRGEGAWVLCLCISCNGDGGQLGSSFLWSERGG